jgi:uncharacterized protein (TIGR03067 family)
MNPLLLGLAAAIGAPALKDSPKDELAIIGDWKLVEWLQGGQKIGIADGAGVEFLPGGKRLWRDGPGDPDTRSYKLYPKTSPAEIDLIRTDVGPTPVVYPCIFKVEGETLVIAVGNEREERPKSFDPAAASMLMTFHRLKKKN